MLDHPILKDVPANLIAALKRRGWDLAQILLDAQQTQARFDHGRKKYRNDQTVTGALRVPARFVTDLVDVLADMAREITRNESGLIDTAEWDKPYEPGTDRAYDAILDQLEKHGFPIPQRLITTRAGDDIDPTEQTEADLRTRRRIKQHAKGLRETLAQEAALEKLMDRVEFVDDDETTTVSAGASVRLNANGDPVCVDDEGALLQAGMVANLPLTAELARACLQNSRPEHSMGVCNVPGCDGGKNCTLMREHVLGLRAADTTAADDPVAVTKIWAGDPVYVDDGNKLRPVQVPHSTTWDDIYEQAASNNELVELGQEPDEIRIPMAFVISPAMAAAIEDAGKVEVRDGEEYGCMDCALPVPVTLEHAQHRPLYMRNELLYCHSYSAEGGPPIVYVAERNRFEMRGGRIELTVTATNIIDSAVALQQKKLDVPFRLRIKGAAFEGKPLHALVRFAEEPAEVLLRTGSAVTGARLVFDVVDPAQQPLLVRIFDDEGPKLGYSAIAESVSKSARGRVHIVATRRDADELLRMLQEKKRYHIYMPRMHGVGVQHICTGLFLGALPRQDKMDLSFVPVDLLTARTLCGTKAGSSVYIDKENGGLSPIPVERRLWLDERLVEIDRVDIPDSVTRNLVTEGGIGKPASPTRPGHIRLGPGTIQIWTTEQACLQEGVRDVLERGKPGSGDKVLWGRLPQSYVHEEHGPLDVQFTGRIVDEDYPDAVFARVRITMELV